MYIFKRILNFYINSSIHVALAVVSLSYITLLEFHVPYDKPLLHFIFYASVTGYNFVKFYGIAKFHHRSLTKWLKWIQVFSLICFVLMCYYALRLEKNIILYLIGFALITFFYAIPFFPSKKFFEEHNSLRNIEGLKVFLIALVWAGVTVFLPLLNNHYVINGNVFITGIQRFLLVIMLMLPFEIRDLKYDNLQLSTIPQKLGINGTKTIGALLGLTFFGLEFFKGETGLNQYIILLIVCIVTLLFVLFSKESQGKYYAAFWVEGIPFLWLSLIWWFN